MPSSTGQKALAFSLKDQRCKPALLPDCGGSVVVYFYPKDDTPGCTKESCDFRDNLVRFSASTSVLASAFWTKPAAKFMEKYH